MPKGEQKYILNKLQSKIYQGDIHLFPVTAKNCASIMYMYELLYVVVLHACMHNARLGTGTCSIRVKLIADSAA